MKNKLYLSTLCRKKDHSLHIFHYWQLKVRRQTLISRSLGCDAEEEASIVVCGSAVAGILVVGGLISVKLK